MYSEKRLGKMDRSWISVVILSVFSVAVVAYRNDLSSSRHGCIWSTVENVGREKKEIVGSGGGVGHVLQPQNGVMLNCHVRTLSVDFGNYTFDREQLEQTKLLRVECNDKLFFESFLSPNQTLFQMTNLREVQIESCKIRKVPQRVWASLSSLKSLTVRTQNVDWGNAIGLEIEEGSFDGLSKLETLDLSQNNIWSLGDKKMLCPLRNLLKLNVSRNRLSDIEELHTSESEDSETVLGDETSSPDNYCALSVTNVDLSFNSLRRVGHHGFSRMRRLTELRLQNNLIEELEDTAFHGLSQLKLVNLSSNRLVALPPSIFKSNSNLREVYLQNNSISALSPSVFSQLEQLLLLDLSHNTLTSQWIKDNMFTSLVRLVVLKLSFNQLSIVDSTIFQNLISLQALHLDNNRIETLHPEAFAVLSNLHILVLSRNRITMIDSRIFSRLFVLRQLFMDHNKIKDIEDNSFKNCTSLQELVLEDNILQEVPVALRVAGLGLLKTLDLGENRIVSVNNESFSGMSQLYGLRLVDNRLTELPHGFCDPLKELRVLNFAQNRIAKIASTSFRACNELRVLRLDANALDQLPNTLPPQLPSLLYLNVSENHLRWVDYSSLPPTIEWLDLSYNSLETLGSPDPSLPPSQEKNKHSLPYHLRILDVSHNSLTHLDYTSIPASLETLRVNHNHLKNVAPDTFIRSNRLRRVELIGNQLENLPLAALRFPQIPSGRPLPEFYLGANPFHCDCTMEWLTRVNQLAVLRQHPRIVDLDAIVCRPSFSRSNSIVPLVETRAKDFLCPYKSHCFALCHCCDFDACDCQMTCPGNCTCFHDTAWSSNIVQCSNLDYTEIPERIPMDATEIYLDGNNISNLSSHIFIGKKNLRSLFLNGSHIEFIRNKTFNGLKSLEVLRLEDNSLNQLHGYEFADLEGLRELYLQNNLLRFISSNSFTHLEFLQVLRLDGNLLVDFNVWELSGNAYLNSVMLAGNPWSCECEFLIPFRSWVAGKTSIVVDFSDAKCQAEGSSGNPKSNSSNDLKPHPTISSMCNNLPEITFNYNENMNGDESYINNQISAMGGAEKVAVAHPPHQNDRKNLLAKDLQDYNLLWSLLLSLSVLLIVVMVIVLIFRRELSYFCTNLLSYCCTGKSSKKEVNTTSEDTEKLFDAYFLYSKKDDDLLQEKIAPELESAGGPDKFRLCFHYRDLCLNSDNPWNSEMILSACDASKRVVIVFSNNFLQGEWANVHFRAAIQTALNRHQKKIVFILLPPLATSNLSTLFTDFNVELNVNNRGKNSNPSSPPAVQWSDKNFWTKFKLHLPTPSFSNYQENSELPLNARQFPYNSSHHYHRNIIPYQIPLSRNNSLPPGSMMGNEGIVPKHQIVLPGQHWLQNSNHHQHHHMGNATSVHPVPPQITPMHFAYNNEAFHQHLLLQPPQHPVTISRQLQPIHFTHEHQHSHSSSSYRPILDQYSSSAVSSANEHEEMDHVYSTLDSPLQSPMSGDSHFDCSLHSQTQSQTSHTNDCNINNNGKHKLQHSTSSGISSASDLTAVTGTSPSSLAICNSDSENNKNCNPGPANGQMYFV